MKLTEALIHLGLKPTQVHWHSKGEFKGTGLWPAIPLRSVSVHFKQACRLHFLGFFLPVVLWGDGIALLDLSDV